MSLQNDALLFTLAQDDLPVVDAMVASNTSATTGTRLTGSVCRFIKVASGGTAVLPSMLSFEASSMLYVINDDTTNALAVAPFGTETINGSNAVLSGGVAAGKAAVFYSSSGAKIAKGGGVVPGSVTNDWRAVAFP